MNTPRRVWLRLVPVFVLLLGAGFFLQSRAHPELEIPRESFLEFPRELNGWRGTDVAIEPEVLEVLRADDTIVRIFFHEEDRPPVDIYMAYFRSQRTGATIHSPQNCLPGAGWAPAEAGRLEIAAPDGETITVNRYRIAKGLDQRLVLYWYQSHGRVIASEYWAKIFLVTDAIRLNRTDGALVRLTTPIARDETPADAEHRLVDFARRAFVELPRFVPR
jgi:EpsI family protein